MFLNKISCSFKFSDSKLLHTRKGQGFILVYSITSRASFEHVSLFHQLVKLNHQGNPTFLLVGTQSDRRNERKVSREEGLNLATTLGCKFMETSAKTSRNVDHAFSSMVRSLRYFSELPTFEDPKTIRPVKCKHPKCIIM